jgi:CRP/FNR family transcriptional regulator
MDNNEQRICDQVGLAADTLSCHDISLSVIKIDKGTVLFRPGDNCQTFLILCTGSIRVEMTAKSGRDVTLYRISPTESCILTTSALINSELYYAQGVAESDITAIALSTENFNKAIQVSKVFVQYVLSGYANRVSSVIKLVDRMATKNVMLDVSRYLVENIDENFVVALTQTQIANEVGTAREVVGRKLQTLEAEGIVALKRGAINVVDIAALKKHAQLSL